MTQFRFHIFKRPIDSFSENERMLGILQAGRYIGFDTFNQTGSLAGDLLHTTTGVEKTDVALSVSAQQGALLTPQGVMIYEDGAISISGFSSNVGNNDRLDLIICEHEYLASVGGQVATYSIIEGTPATGADDIPVAPALTNPEKQTIIGKMFIPGGDADLNNAIYTGGVPTTSGGLGQALLDQIQQFTKMQSFSKGTDIEVKGTTNLIKLNDEGNLFECVLNTSICNGMEDKPVGTRVSVTLKTGSSSSCSFKDGVGGLDVGYIPFSFGADLIFVTGNTLVFERISTPSDEWVLISASPNALDILTNANDIADILDGTSPFIGAPTFLFGINNGGTVLKTKVISIGDWDMDADAAKTVAHGLTLSKIRSIAVMIIRDDSALQIPLERGGEILSIDTSTINLTRDAVPPFDGTDYDSTSFNRGWVYITYEA